MSEWKKVKLGDLFERVTRKNTNLESDNVLTISAQYGLINQEEFFNKSVAGKNLKNYYLLRKGEFAYNKSYSVGYPMGATKMLEKYDEGIVSTLYICFRSKSDLVNKEYFKYYFESKQYYDELSKIAQEGARNHGLLNVSIEDFFNIKLKLPTYQEQKIISKIIEIIEKLMKNNEEKINQNNKLLKGIYQKLFNKEEKYDIKLLKEVAEFKNGKAHEKVTEKSGKYILITSKAISTNLEEYRRTNKLLMPLAKNQIVMVMSDLPKGKALARCLIIDKDNLYTLNQRVCSLGNFEMDAYFLCYQLNRNGYFLKYDDGVNQTNLRKEDILNCPIIIPPKNLQEKFTTVARNIEKENLILRDQNKEYGKLRKYVMQKLLTGKVKINV